MDDPSAPPSAGNTNFTQGILILTIIPMTLSATAAVLRFATRAFIVKGLGWDDLAMLFAIFGTTIGMALDFVEVHYGFGRHKAYLTPHQLQEFQKFTYGEWIQTFATLMWTKVSICLFLLRIPFKKSFVRPLQAALVILILSNVVLTTLWILQCRPVASVWDNSIDGKCFSKRQIESIIFTQAIISVVSDFSFATYPILLLWNVQIHWKSKVGLCCLMGLGVFTGSCCIVRTVLNGGAVPGDVTYSGLVNWIWRAFEVHIGIIAACIPTLRPGYKWLVQKLRATRRTSSIHLPLADGPQNGFKREWKTTVPSNASWAQDRDLGLLDSHTLKTTKVDVEQGLSNGQKI